MKNNNVTSKKRASKTVAKDYYFRAIRKKDCSELVCYFRIRKKDMGHRTGCFIKAIIYVSKSIFKMTKRVYSIFFNCLRSQIFRLYNVQV